ncbi:SGNH/GDSL hydrolase family protein [Canibacter zhoujuaniae]|uniref:SGNH/GDSL hydrolase family protein n=1 Tax=Canibacter zhoujuaniae TaxID=2708343 RepID=UPI001FBC0288|nr:SGNH/GDSL hydrolase family protein [Canibacter zhoujuaniae]
MSNNKTQSATDSVRIPNQEELDAAALRAREKAAVNEGLRLPWNRMVVIGDSFAEGVGDPDDTAPGGLRGWADRVATVLAKHNPDLAYANLAVRGKVIDQVIAEQVDKALALKPDLVFISAGGNDVLRPKANIIEIIAKQESIVKRFTEAGATVVLFSAFDSSEGVFKAIYSRAALYSMHQRTVAERYDAIIVNLWARTELTDSRYWAEDRLHLNPLGHHAVAICILDSLNVPHSLEARKPEPAPVRTWREARKEDAVWAREYLLPWVIRRIRRVSSGDNVEPKRPEPGPVE